MATVSQTTTALPPTGLPSPSYVWEDAVPAGPEALDDEKAPANDETLHASARPPLASQNGNSTMRAVTAGEPLSPRSGNEDSGPEISVQSDDVAPHDPKDLAPRSLKDPTNSENSLDPYAVSNGDRSESTFRKGPNGLFGDSDSDDNSKWIHRDKLARIESEELQAAGIFLPRQRDRARSKSQNRPKRDQSQDKINGSSRSIGGSEYAVSRSRKNSTATSVETRTIDLTTIPSWDLRRPEEILEEGGDGHSVSASSGKGSSRIPVAKTSPVPIPSEHLARDTRLARKRDGSPNGEESITYPKQRSRSGSTGTALAKTPGSTPGTAGKRPDSSPKKSATGTSPATATTPTAARKPKPANGAAGRPKTRGGPSKDSTSSGTGTTRPSTRSGEREFSSSNSKPMEGEPPWMVSAYRPDPRLPPDQQLLPTVAKRLQQEKWEREGKFGSVYDKEFRPLTDEGFLKPPESSGQDKDDEKEEDKEECQNEEQGEWPLKAEPKSPTLPGRSNSYSTMPKISDAASATPLPRPRTPGHQTQPSQTVRVPEPPEDPKDKKAGCGCCIVM